jgi:hypothetical protein
MSAHSTDTTASDTARDAANVTAYLEASMVPDPERAATYMAPASAIGRKRPAASSKYSRDSR